MEIDMPDYGIGIWIEGDDLVLRFPDRQLVKVPVAEFPRVINVLRTRWEYAQRQERMGIGTTAAPVQHDWDLVREHLSRADVEAAKAEKDAKRCAQAQARAQRERRRIEKKVAKRDADKAAHNLLTSLGL